MTTRFTAGLTAGYFRLLEFAIVACLTLMIVMVFGNVVLRYAFNSGITMSEELSRLLFVWLTFLGAILALHERAHLGMDTLVQRLPSLGKRLCLIASLLLMLWVSWLLLSGSWQQTVINIATEMPASGLSQALLYAVGVVFGVSALLIITGQLYRVLTGQVSDDELVMVKDSEEQAEFEELQKELALQHARDDLRSANADVEGKRP